jgi:cadmium resistance protein CadD (predicted permease)
MHIHPMAVYSTIGLAVVVFASSNIDNLFVLLGFFADPRFGARQVALGQYLGVAALLAVSTIASLAALLVPSPYIGLLGLVPLGIGVKKLVDDSNREANSATRAMPGKFGQTLMVATVTIANGGDNIGIYVPVFATQPTTALVIMTPVFALLVTVWLLFAHWLVNHRALGAPLRRCARLGTPLVLIAVGLSVIYRAGSLSLLR